MSRPVVVVSSIVGLLAAGTIGYALYFDYRRRNDAAFRRVLRRESKRVAKEERISAAQEGAAKEKPILEAMRTAQSELPRNMAPGSRESEEFFLTTIQQAEMMGQSGQELEAAAQFYKALKAYPSPRELMNIYDRTVPKSILDMIAVMIAHDSDITIGGGSTGEMSEDEEVI